MTVSQLPDLVVLKIFQFLLFRHQLRLGATCRRLHRLHLTFCSTGLTISTDSRSEYVRTIDFGLFTSTRTQLARLNFWCVFDWPQKAHQLFQSVFFQTVRRLHLFDDQNRFLEAKTFEIFLALVRQRLQADRHHLIVLHLHMSFSAQQLHKLIQTIHSFGQRLEFFGLYRPNRGSPVQDCRLCLNLLPCLRNLHSDHHWLLNAPDYLGDIQANLKVIQLCDSFLTIDPNKQPQQRLELLECKFSEHMWPIHLIDSLVIRLDQPLFLSLDSYLNTPTVKSRLHCSFHLQQLMVDWQLSSHNIWLQEILCNFLQQCSQLKVLAMLRHRLSETFCETIATNCCQLERLIFVSNEIHPTQRLLPMLRKLSRLTDLELHPVSDQTRVELIHFFVSKAKQSVATSFRLSVTKGVEMDKSCLPTNLMVVEPSFTYF